MRGSSHEILRNKILFHRSSINSLEKNISEVLEDKVKINLPSPESTNGDEFIKIGIQINDEKERELYLQGSGCLQVFEILSTLDLANSSVLKLFLIDEPDSHIHSKLQDNIINHLKKQEKIQFFIISHNDQFVSSANENEIFYLNKNIKETKLLNHITFDSFQLIKRELGGVIYSLQQLNNSKHIVFVEGEDDASYLTKLIKDLNAIGIITHDTYSQWKKEITFFH